MPADHQSCPGWKSDPPNVIAYEGLRKDGIRRTSPPGERVVTARLDRSPYATGDPGVMGWAKTDLGVYGSSHVGYLAALIDWTNHEHILRINLLATDFFHDRAYPSYLYYNPDGERRPVEIDVGPAVRDLYETTAHRFVARGVLGKTTISVPPDAAVVIVLAPAGGRVETRGRRTLVDGVVVDYGR